MKLVEQEIALVSVADIVVPKGRRSVGDVSSLAEAISANGNRLINPLTVMRTDDGKYRLIAGGRRLAALKSIDCGQVGVQVMDVSEVEAEIIEIDENFERQELSELERSEQRGRRKRLYEALHPETKRGVSGAAASNKAQGKGHATDKKSVASFATEAAKKGGVSERTIHREVEIATKIDRKARDLIRDTPTAHSKTDLLKLAKAKPEVQVAAARKIQSGEAKDVVQAVRAVAREEKREEMEQKAKAAEVVVRQGAAVGRLPWGLTVGDCVAELAKVPTGSVRLVCADPPYNIGRDYHGQGAAADRAPDADYLSFCESWMRECARTLTDDGSLWLIVSNDYVDDLAVILRRKLGLHRLGWIIWYETFGMHRAGYFGRCSRHILHMVKDPSRFVFNESAVMGPSVRLIMGDKRADPAGKVYSDVWGVPWLSDGDDAASVVRYDPLPRITGNHPEKVHGFDNQLPIALCDRIIRVASEPGDRVLDPFNGTGTTGVASILAGRLYTGIEKNAAAVATAETRFKGAYADVQACQRRTA